MLTRREWLMGASAGAILLGMPKQVEARFPHGSAVATSTNPLQSQRNGINQNQFGFSFDFAFINHITYGGGVGPGSGFRTGSSFQSLLDANGYPQTSDQWGDSVSLPAPNKFTGTWIVAWDGDGTLNIQNAYTFTPVAGTQYTSTYTGSGGIFTNVAGKSAYIGLQFTNSFYGNDGDANVPWSFTNSGAVNGGTSGFVRNLRWYRLEDETDLLAGKIYRAAYKQELANLNPSFIRFMNWTGGNTSNHIRFEDRALPSMVGVNQHWLCSPVYPDSTGVNQFVVGSPTPTTGNPKTMPASMKNGEVCTFRTSATSMSARCAGTGTGVQSNDGGVKILTIEQSTVTAGLHPVVQTNGNHNFNTGDKIVHVNLTTGMTGLNLVPCNITVIDANHYAIDVDTHLFGAFDATNVRSNATQFTTLQVGSGNDRVGYPLILTRGDTYISQITNYFGASNYQTAIFNKSIIMQRTAAGANVPGAWIVVNTTTFGGSGGFFSDVPLEYCSSLINEVNATLPNGRPPIHMYWDVPAMGLNSFDADYSAVSNWAVKGMDVILNGSTVGGVTYLGLTAKASVLLEFFNETWNGTSLTVLLAYVGTYPPYNAPVTDRDTYSSVRMVQCFKDLQAAYPGNPRIKYMLGLAYNGGYTTGQANDFRINGTAIYLSVTGYGKPINYADAAVISPYIDVMGTAYYSTTTGTGCLTDDCAMYGGFDNSGALSMTGGNGGVSGDTLTITAVASQTPVVNQALVGTGISPGTYIIGVSGTSPNYTLTLNPNANATVANGTTITSPANSGGNYIGAANQAQAVTNFVNQNNDGPLGAGTNQNCLKFILNGTMKTIADNLIPTGKFLCQYEGGTNWLTRASGFPVGYPALSIAAINSSQWGAAQIAFWNNSGNYSPKLTMPALYLWVATQPPNADQQWAYALPDTYAKVAGTWTEGAALSNNPSWAAFSARNQAIF